MRVIAGMARGKQLIAPTGMHTRPITDQIKEALFSSWQTRILDANFLDLFSGSGGVGIEAMSRGAQRTVFVDNDKEAISVIRKNVASTKLTSYHEIHHDDVFSRIKRLENGVKFDLIYMDPPYTVDEIMIPSLEAVGNANLLHEDGVLAIRTPKTKEMPEEVPGLVKVRIKTYGISTMHFYEVK